MGKDLNGKELGKNLFQRKDGRYEAKYTDNFGKRHSIYDKKLKEIRRKLNEALYEKENNIFSKKCRLTVDEWFHCWVEHYKKNTVKKSTLSNIYYQYSLYIKEYIGDMKLNNINSIHVQSIFNILYEKGYLKETIKGIFHVLNQMMECAKKNYCIVQNPCENIKIKSQREPKKRESLSLFEQEIFLKFARNTYFYNLFIVLLLTGMRIGEAAALKWEDIDFDKHVININKTTGFCKDINTFKDIRYFQTPKTKSSIRTIPLCENCAELLNKMKKISSNSSNNALVFTNKNGDYIKTSSVNRSIKRIIAKINKSGQYSFNKNVSSHCFRHTFATRCFERGISPKIVQSILGHDSLQMTMDLYTHVAEEKKLEEIYKINNIL